MKKKKNRVILTDRIGRSRVLINPKNLGFYEKSSNACVNPKEYDYMISKGYAVNNMFVKGGVLMVRAKKMDISPMVQKKRAPVLVYFILLIILLGLVYGLQQAI